MGILQDIISEAAARNGSPTYLLRNCLILAARLPHKPLGEWATSELQGYTQDAAVPEYRRLGTRNRGQFWVPYHQPGVLDIPISSLPEALREHYSAYLCRDSIAECTHLLASQEKGSGNLRVPWPLEHALLYAGKHVRNGQCLEAWMEISPGMMAAIVDIVKTKVLAFALEIEAADPSAGTLSKVGSPIDTGRIATIFQTNITGGTFHNTALGGNEVLQTTVEVQKVPQGDAAALRSALASLGIEPGEVECLEVSIAADAFEKKSGLGTRAQTWLAGLASKAAAKGVETGASLATSAVTKAVLQFLGMSS